MEEHYSITEEFGVLTRLICIVARTLVKLLVN